MKLHALIGEESVTDPSGRDWKVGVRWLPREPRWIGWGPGRRSRKNQARRGKPENGDTSWMDALDFPIPDDFPALFVVAAIVLALLLAWFLVLPIAIFALDLLFVALLTVATIAARVLFRRPWIVEATTDDEQRFWPVVGLQSSRQMVGEVVWSLQKGEDI